MFTIKSPLRCLKGILALACLVNAASADQFGYFTYTENGSTVTITDYPDDAQGDVVIPSSIVGKPVTAIGNYAFEFCSGLTSVTIPNSITSIGIGAFKGCSGLTSVAIPASVNLIASLVFYECSSLASITIPDSVTRINGHAFARCSSLTGVTIPASVTMIDDKAFFDCRGLIATTVDESNPNFSSLDGIFFNKLKTKLIQCPGSYSGTFDIPGTVTSISPFAFYYCSGLTSVTIPASVSSIGESTFESCSGLTSVFIPASITSIGESAFNDCSSLTSVAIPSSVTSIGDSAFSGCSGLTSVAIPASVSSIAYGTFRSCYGLTSVTIPSSVTTIGDSAFSTCGGLTSLTIPASVTSIGNDAFERCIGLTSITIPNSVTSIGHSAFSYCYGLTCVTIPDSVTSIGHSVFYSCVGLTSVTIPSSVTSIGDSAFSSCSGLTSVSISASVTSIGDGAFSGCSSLTTITVDEANPNYSSWDGALFDKLQTTLIQCPGGYSGTFEIPASVTTITSFAFPYCHGLTSVIIPDTMTSIGDWTFSYCSGLTSITIPDSVTSIGAAAFSYCGNLASVTIPDSVTSIGGYAFNYCSALTVVTIPASVSSIANGTFSSCSGLTSITIPASVTSIGDYAFHLCSSLAIVAIPASVASIGYDAFSRCGSLTTIAVDGANLDYSSLDGILFNKLKSTLIQCPGGYSGFFNIPASVTMIESTAFFACSGLTGVTIPASVSSIGYSVFADCSALTTITVDEANPKYSSLNGVLFDKLKTTLIQCPGGYSGVFEIPASVTTIDFSAFFSCSGLTSVTIPDSGILIGESTFSQCSGLATITVDGMNPNYSSVDGILFDKLQTTLVHCPRGYSGALNLPASVTSIDYLALYGCSGLTKIMVDEANPNYSSLDGVLFDKLKTTLIQCPGGYSGSLNLPASVASLETYFSDCIGLTAITVDEANPIFGSLNGMLFDKLHKVLIRCPRGFSGCLSIPDSVTYIYTGALSDCSGLTSVTIPVSLISISDDAFYSCSGLTSVYFLGDAPRLDYSLALDTPQRESNYTNYCFADKTGFTFPTWNGYPTVSMGASSPLTEWLITHELPFDSDPLADANGDSVSLLMAYALNLDPNQNLSGSMPQPQVAGDQMNLSFYSGSEGVAYTVEYSTDLQHWSAEDVMLSEPDADQIRTATVPVSGPARFMRLGVSQ